MQENVFYCQTLKQVSQKYCEVSTCGRSQNPAGHGAGQAAAADPN